MYSIPGFTNLQPLLEERTHVLLRAWRGDRSFLVRLPREESPSPEELARLRYGYELSATLDLPGIVKALELVRSGNQLCLVMEDFGGLPLRSLLKTGALPPRQVLDIALRLARILGELHQRRVIHKDLTPANILLHPETGEVRIANFDLASRLSSEAPSFTSHAILHGDLAYISPEQTGRMNRAVDYRTDFYSLGITLYELLTGRPPFTSADPTSLVYSHLAVEPSPPHQLQQEVPQTLSAVVLKLLAKNAEERYQSAYGLSADLKLCREQLGVPEPLTPGLRPGQRDVSASFNLSQKLYGRETDAAQLAAAFQRVSQGDQAELLLVTGYSGIGKSSLVNEVHRPLVRLRGYFGSGKFDQFLSSPYAAWIQAFDGLVRQILSEDEQRIATWKAELLAALGPNGRVVTDVVPQIELIIGPQPPVPALGALESQNRFNLVFQRLVGAFAVPQHPLVLFLDDLQWADAASLGLLQRVLSDPSYRHLLVIGAYRDNEVRAGHPLLATLNELRQSAPVSEISLRPLGQDSVTQLLEDTVGRPGDPAVAELAALVFQKTQGNPFFVNQFVTTLHERGYITFDPEQGRWRWELERIRSMGITDNVAVLMAERLAALPPATQEALKRAACIGSTFNLEVISIINERSPREAAAALWEAVQLGLLLPVGDSYKYVLGQEAGTASIEPSLVRYEFLHDRVQEAAYSLISEDARKRLHLRIGRLMLERTPEVQRDASIFEIVHQLDLATELIDSPEERERLARLNLVAGMRAKRSSAYKEALRYLQVGISLLREDGWERQYELALPLHRHGSECLHQLGRYDDAEREFQLILRHARSVEEKTEIYVLMLDMFVSRGQYLQAIQPARAALRELGIELPEGPEASSAAIAQERKLLEENLAHRSIASLAELPQTTNSRERARILLISRALSYAAYVYPDLFQILSMMTVNRAIAHGHGPGSGTAYALYAIALASGGSYERAFEFGQLAMKLGERYDPLGERPMIRFLFASFQNSWCKPLETSMRILEQGFQAALESGMFFWAGLCSMQLGISGQLGGEDLSVQLARLQWHVDFYSRGGSQFHQSICQVAASMHSVLRLMHGAIPSGSPQYLDEAYLLQNLQNPTVSAGFAVLLLRLEYLLDLPNPREALTRAESQIGMIQGWVSRAEFTLYQGLVLAAQHASADAEERARIEQTLEANEESLRNLSTLCPENFLQKHRLLAAERARLAGRELEAMALYDEAITAAAKHGIIHEEALANELAARFLLGIGRQRSARGYLEEARMGYGRWGARAKVAALERQYPKLLRSSAATGSDAGTSLEGLDLAAVLKATQAISGEIVLSELLQKLMGTILENAGAQRGLLLLKGEPPLAVEARQQEGARTEVQVHDSTARAMEHAPETILRYVERTRERLVLSESTSRSAFQGDTYLASQRPRSVLCMPVLKQKQLVGTLYLENQLVADAFTPERCKVLELLSAQAAVSLENARLYDTLDQRVRERTRELRASNDELAQTLQQLKQTQAQLVMKEKLASLGVLTSGVAHEIRNPLNFISSFSLFSLQLTDELRTLSTSQRPRLEPKKADELDRIIGHLRQSVQKIDEHGKRVDAIVRSMLDLSRTSNTSEHALVPLNDLIKEYVHLAYSGLRAQQLSFHAEIETRFDPELQPVEVMPQELGRVILNLVNNACYAVDERRKKQGANFIPTVQVVTKDLGDRVEIRVHDNGTGIPASILDKIFNPFFTTKPAGQGTGLGLSISHEIVVQGHGGKLEVESEEGRYTEFRITLPRRARRTGALAT
ncbi:trifunctional serine/threonine-protein kinase/ATP-binding protein/sensor histidine kinase [Hyalangium versicolor]|uniref:trifunctional serine/threonine-protein kinase/ATP-binding protein/sensor histidine kinase n=1 Tax=Hyalangium versicolor TaxID=2861190 RepID=UPI001CCE8873|nr:ATP-binding sensor histidine kinase [Hyalangium versicolor]